MLALGKRGYEHFAVAEGCVSKVVEIGFGRLSERVEFCGGQAARSRVSSAIS